MGQLARWFDRLLHGLAPGSRAGRGGRCGAPDNGAPRGGALNGGAPGGSPARPDCTASRRPGFKRLRAGDSSPPPVCRRCRAPLDPAARWCVHCGTRMR